MLTSAPAGEEVLLWRPHLPEDVRPLLQVQGQASEGQLSQSRSEPSKQQAQEDLTLGGL